MILSELLRKTRVRIPSELSQVEISSIDDDSRKIVPGSLFVAVKGFETDGHIFVEQAMERGAAAVLAEHPVSGDHRICVNPEHDNRRILSLLAARFYDFPWDDLITIGITGTNGKTSTARKVHWIFEKHGIQKNTI